MTLYVAFGTLVSRSGDFIDHESVNAKRCASGRQASIALLARPYRRT